MRYPIPSDASNDVIGRHPLYRPLLIISSVISSPSRHHLVSDTGWYRNVIHRMRYRIRRNPASAKPHLIALLLPAPLPAEPCRPTGRLEARRHPTRYSPRLISLACSYRRHLIGSSVSLVACYAPTHAANPSHPSHPLRYISSAHLPSRHTSRPASRRASRLAYLPTPSISSVSFHLIGSSPTSHHSPIG